MATTVETTDLAGRLRRAASATALDQVDVAKLMGSDPRTVARWLSSQATPRSATRKRLLETIVVLESLSSVVRPEVAHDWLFTPNRLLDFAKPADLLQEGEWRRVLGLVEALADGVFV